MVVFYKKSSKRPFDLMGSFKGFETEKKLLDCRGIFAVMLNLFQHL
jgi:hypothetical protein